MFSEPNGLRHGEFDVQYPQIEGVGPKDVWEVCSLEWDVSSSILAVGLQLVPEKGEAEAVGAVQLYYRSNYRWYLKQQWFDVGMKFLGFDTEIATRLYLTCSTTISEHRVSVLRVVDLVWDVFSADSRDATVAVVDGSSLLLTPLGYNLVPPPMSKHVVELPSTCRQASFWVQHNEEFIKRSIKQHKWLLTCLLDDSDRFLICTGDSQGNPLASNSVSVRHILRQLADSYQRSLALEDIRKMSFRSILSTEDANSISIVILGAIGRSLATGEAVGGGDVLLIIRGKLIPSASSFDFLMDQISLLRNIPGKVSHITTIPGRSDSIAVGMVNSLTSSYDILRIKVTHTTLDGNNFEVSFASHVEEDLAEVPESCTKFSILYDPAMLSDNFRQLQEGVLVGSSAVSPHYRSSSPPCGNSAESMPKLTVVSMSARNRLYCGETLLVSGSSSYAYNGSHGILMYITLGTKPHMHYCSYESLAKIDPLLGEEQLLIECEEPRPLERGAKLVAAVFNDSKVLVQMPRGNLETFEPRILVLLSAQKLLDANCYLKCLVLFRRQRVDLNYLVDYDPTLFMTNIPCLVTDALAADTDLLSLFILALDPANVAITKYYRSMIVSNKQSKCHDVVANGVEKVNKVCEAMRNALLRCLYKNRDDGSLEFDTIVDTRALNPILCTLAKQDPPALVEALQTIRRVSNITKSGPLLQGSLKYLAFLVQSEPLFQAALGSCDFDVTRAVARQCQMDPKEYLPLIESFEMIGKGHDEGSIMFNLMHFKVNLHLKRHKEAVEWGCKLVEVYSGNKSESAHKEIIVSTTSTVVSLVETDKLFDIILPKLISLETIYGAKLQQMQDLLSLINQIRSCHGRCCVVAGEYSVAVSSFLSMDPPDAVKAVTAAIQWGNWKLAMTLSVRYQREERYKSCGDLSPLRVAQSIVCEFKEKLEQGESHSAVFSADTAADIISSRQSKANLLASSNSNWSGSDKKNSESHRQLNDDRVAIAASLCIDYCNADSESAVYILTSNRRWMAAVEIASRYGRNDLLEEVIPLLIHLNSIKHLCISIYVPKIC